eukprot:3064759-Pyramimonas_sp.AAC.1
MDGADRAERQRGGGGRPLPAARGHLRRRCAPSCQVPSLAHLPAVTPQPIGNIYPNGDDTGPILNTFFQSPKD